MQFALQMYENAVALDPGFAVAHAAIANVCAQFYYYFERKQEWIDRVNAATKRAIATGRDEPEIRCAEAWLDFAQGRYDSAVDKCRSALARDPDIDGGYNLLGRALFEAGRYQEVVDIMEDILAHAGENYNNTIPIHNSLGAMGKTEALKNYTYREIALYEAQLKKTPEDARVRVLLAGNYAAQGRFDDAKRETDLAMALRPDDTMILYNIACTLCEMDDLQEAMHVLKKAWDAGYRNPAWIRQDPDLTKLHGDPDFERMFPDANKPATLHAAEESR